MDIACDGPRASTRFKKINNPCGIPLVLNLRIDSSGLLTASSLEGQGDLLMLRAYKESSNPGGRIECIKKAIVCYDESCSLYQKSSMPLSSKAVRRKIRETAAALEFETKHRGGENPMLKDIVGKLVRNKDMRARLGMGKSKK